MHECVLLIVKCVIIGTQMQLPFLCLLCVCIKLMHEVII